MNTTMMNWQPTTLCATSGQNCGAGRKGAERHVRKEDNDSRPVTKLDHHCKNNSMASANKVCR